MRRTGVLHSRYFRLWNILYKTNVEIEDTDLDTHRVSSMCYLFTTYLRLFPHGLVCFPFIVMHGDHDTLYRSLSDPNSLNFLGQKIRKKKKISTHPFTDLVSMVFEGSTGRRITLETRSVVPVVEDQGLDSWSTYLHPCTQSWETLEEKKWSFVPLDLIFNVIDYK